MNTHTFRAVIEKDDTGYHGFVPALPGCHTAGGTIEETRSNLKEAIQGYLEVLAENNEPIPEDQSLEVLEKVEV